jgi:cation diffusion facilitator CzcD-associated flavoprotein CzcO
MVKFPGTDLTQEQRDLVMEIADFKKMNQLRDRVEAVVRDKETAEALKPWYRHACKRPTFSDEYLPTFNRPNVTLVDTQGRGVERITEHGMVSREVEYPVDCIIFATGFQVGQSHPAFSGLPIHGRDGITLVQHWEDGMRTLHGLTSHGFPNLFCMGSLQNAAAVNFTHILDEQATHIAAVIGTAEQHGARYVEPSAKAEQDWVDLIRSNARLDPVLAECTPGYYNNEGQPKARQLYNGGAIEFHELLRAWRADNLCDDMLVY